MKWFNKLRVKTVLTILVAIMILGMSIIAAGVLIKSRGALLGERRAKLEALVDSMSAVTDYYYRKQQRGELTESQAQEGAREHLRTVHFDQSNYFFVIKMTGEYVLLPPKPEWEGQNKLDLRDGKGRYFIREFVSVAKKDHDGYVYYDFPRPGGKDPVAKLSRIKLFEPWGWMIGAGVYIDDVNATFWSDALVCLGFLTVLLGIAIGFAILVGRGLMRQLGAEPAVARAVVQEVVAGNLDVAIPIESGDTSSLIAAMGGLRDRLQGFVAEQQQLSVHHAEGLVSARMDTGRFPGVYGAIGRQINSLIDGHTAIQNRVMEVIAQYAHGDFSSVLESLPGERAAIKEAVDGVRRNLMSVNDDLMMLVAAAGRGDFTVRGDAGKYHHDFRKMIEGLNRLMQVSATGLDEVARVLGALAKGDLSEKITNDYSGTFGKLKDDSNQTTARLSEIVHRLREATETINMASKEIASGNTDLSQRTEEQAASLEQTAASMEELKLTVTKNAQSALHANQLAIGASNVAIKGGEVVGQVVETMSSISQSSKKIADIIGVIDAIAFQTNILALNAAVEAARAGEQGRGFAVVASEVRNLAQRCAAAAEEIKSLIGDSVSKVEAGTGLVDEAGRTMSDIVSAVKRVTDIMSEISAASQEQSAGIEQVSLAVSQMDSVTQQNAALVEEAAAASQSLAEQSEVLAREVSVFKVSSDSLKVNLARPRPQISVLAAAS